MKIERRNFIKNMGLCTVAIPLMNLETAFTQPPDTLVEFETSFYKIKLGNIFPFVQYLSVDSLGKGTLHNNPILFPKTNNSEFKIMKQKNKVEFFSLVTSSPHPEWVFRFENKKFTIKSIFSGEQNTAPLEFLIDQQNNHATLLGIMSERTKTNLPALLHLPDMGSLQLTANQKEVTVNYDARRKGNHFVSVSLPPATASQKEIEYSFTVTAIYPEFPGVDQSKYDGYRRNFINLLQINPRAGTIANNSSSDAVAFTLFKSSMLALHTPPLVGSLTALDIIRMSVEKYLNGMKAYGLVGYGDNYEGLDSISWKSPYDSLDANPSLVISACDFIIGSKDLEWGKKYYDKIKEWIDTQLKRDLDNDGLVEYEQSGNTGSWAGGTGMRPANWWDTVGFAHKDAYSNILTYEALSQFAKVAHKLNKNDDAEKYTAKAISLYNIFYKTFYNPQTGVLCGWVSKDNKMHDYYFTFVNAMAVHYNLVPAEKQKNIMLALVKKMEEVGFTDFKLGLPGNLIPIHRGDYTHREHRWGGPELEDGSDAFQIYENGGATACYTYFTISSLRKTGLAAPAEKIMNGLLISYNKGDFQGKCANGMSKDWKTWTGECWGYEGFLADGYLSLLAVK